MDIKGPNFPLYQKMVKIWELKDISAPQKPVRVEYSNKFSLVCIVWPVGKGGREGGREEEAT